MSPEDKLILASARLRHSSDELENIDKLLPLIKDWDYVANNSIERGFGPLLSHKLSLLNKRHLVPDAVKNKLRQAYFHTMTRNMMLCDAFRKIIEAYRHHGISVIALKGIYLSEWLYLDIGLRQMSDIDLLIHESDAPKCIEILGQLGYVPESESNSELDKKHEVVHYTPMIRNGISVELHIKLHQDIEAYHLYPEALWKNAVAARIHHCEVLALGTNDLLIYLCIHLDRHFRQGHIQFTGFSDIANLLEKYSENFDWNEFVATCRYYNCEQPVMGHLLLAHKYLKAPLPAVILKKYGGLLHKKDEQLFLKYFHGHVGFTSGLPKHLSNFGYLPSSGERLRYFLDILFPDKEFMVSKFNMKYPALYPLYYPYRFYLGLRGIVYVIKTKMHDKRQRRIPIN